MLHGNQSCKILTVMQLMRFNRIGHTNSCMFFLHFHDSKSSQQNTQGKSSKADIDDSSLDSTSLVSEDFEHFNGESYFAALEKGLSEKTQRGNSSPSLKQDSTTGCLDSFLARLQDEGISKAASDLISKSRRANCNENYESTWRKWASLCSRREVDSFSSNVNEIPDSLTY